MNRKVSEIHALLDSEMQLFEITSKYEISIEDLAYAAIGERSRKVFENAEFYLNKLMNYFEIEDRRPFEYRSNLFRWASCELLSTIAKDPVKAHILLAGLPEDYQSFLLWGELLDSAYQSIESLQESPFPFSYTESQPLELTFSNEFNNKHLIFWNGGNLISVEGTRLAMPWNDFSYVDYLDFIAQSDSSFSNRIALLNKIFLEASLLHKKLNR